MSRTPFGMPTERRSERRRNASQTRPDQTRVFVTAVCGVSNSNSIHLTVTYGADSGSILGPNTRPSASWMSGYAARAGGR